MSKTAVKTSRALAWLAGLALLLWLLGIGLRQVALTLDPNETKVVELLQLQARPHDVLYLGNSVAFQGINPKVIDDACGVTSYNLAVGGSSPIEQDLILRAYLRHNPAPKLVVIGVTPNLGAFGDDLRPTVYLALEEPEKSYYAQFLQENGLPPLPFSDEIVMRVPAYRHRTTLEPMLKFFVRGEARRPSFVQGHLTYREVGAVPARLPAQRAGLDVAGLRSCLDTCQEHGVPALIVELPNSPSFNKSVVERDGAMKLLHELIDGRQGVSFVSFNEDGGPEFDRADWLGTNHFNSRGAEKFSALLAPRIDSKLRNAL